MIDIMVTRTYDIKLNPSKSQRLQLDSYFREAKWLYNYLLNCSNIFAVHACKVKHIWKLDKDRQRVSVHLTTIPAKIKQNVHRSMLDSIKSLAAVKRSGRVVGHLKYKSDIKSLNFDNQSFSVSDNKHVKLLGFGKNSIRCYGLHQLNGYSKLRNAILQKTVDGYHLKICVSKDIADHHITGDNVRIDFGIKACITLSTGEKFNCKLKETDRLKRLSRRYNRMLLNKNRSNNSQKIKHQLQKEYAKLTNQKRDFANKLIHYLDQFDHIAFQDEQLNGWKNLKSNRRTIQHSCLGLVKSKLMTRASEYPNRYICINKWIPTTKFCPNCGANNKLKLSDRIYKCSCGYTADRDIHAAQNMLYFAKLA